MFGRDISRFYIEDNIVVIKSKAEQARRRRESGNREGKVVDEKKQPCTRVTVLLKGTTLGVTTGGEGDFSIVITDTTKAELVFSFIGMVSPNNPL